MALIEARRLTLPGRIQNVSLALAPGEMLGVIGANGAGKSSLLQSLAGLVPVEGEILIADTPLHDLAHIERARQIGFLPQFCDSAWDLEVAEIVSLGRLPWGDRDSSIGKNAISEAMRETGVLPMKNRNINRLSGGEQARVWLARVLAGKPRLVLADEPVASLDLYYQTRVMDVLRQYAREGCSGAGRDGERCGVILAIHDLALAARYCDSFCLLKQGCIHALGAPEAVLTETVLADAFGVPIHVDLDHEPPIILPI